MGSTAKQFQWLTSLGYTGTLADKQNAYYTDLIANGGNPDQLSAGEFTPEREFLLSNGAGPLASGTLTLAYFTAKRTETITSVTTFTGTTAAGATPTLCRIGVYSVASNGDLTLTASIANDTTLWAATNTAYARNFTSSWSKVGGQRYAAALICVSGAAIPTFMGNTNTSFAVLATSYLLAPALSARITGQTDLPASIAAATPTGFSIRPGFYFAP